MKENICKLIEAATDDRLVTTKFIYERETDRLEFPMRLTEHRMYLCCNGEGICRQEGKEIPLAAGALFFGFENGSIDIRSSDSLEYMYISFRGSRAARLFSRFGIHAARWYFEGFEGLIPLWKENLLRCNKENVDLVSESLLLNAFSRLKGFAPKEDSLVDFVVEYLDSHYSDCELSLGKVAAKAGYHEKYLSHVFKKRFGQSFSEYLKLLRMNRAVFLLENGVTMVKNLAALTGYRDPLYFSKVFSCVIGCSPREYLKKIK